MELTFVDRQEVMGVGSFHKVLVQIQELELQSGFYALPLDEMYMVLGLEWLMQLGKYSTNLEEQFIEFNLQIQHYKLYGVEASTLKKGELQLKKKCMKHIQTYNNESKSDMYPRNVKQSCQTTTRYHTNDTKEPFQYSKQEPRQTSTSRQRQG